MDYAKKKNDELQTLCKERGLPHTGKKADLVKRLEDNEAAGGGAKPAAPAEDEIDWDDEPATEQAKDATSKPAADAIAAGGQGVVDNPQAVPNQQVDVDPSTTNDLTVEGPAAGTEDLAQEAEAEKKEAVDFTSGIEERSFEQDMLKRIERAEKWKTGDVEELKAELDRMRKRHEKFGTLGDAPKGLNSALPEKRERKRGREGEQDDGNRKKRGGRLGGGGGGGGGRDRRPGTGGREPSDRKEGTNGTKTWMTEKDREAAEKRKARWT